MQRLLIDCSSVTAACLHACGSKGENSYEAIFEDKTVTIPSALDAYEYVLTGFKAVLRDLNFVPSQVVLVKDGRNSRAMRRKFLPGYKDRPPRPPEFLEELNKTIAKFEETVWSYGGVSVVKEGIEADDIIFALADVTDATVWSNDKDLMAAKGSWFWSGDLDPTDKFLGISKEHIVIYKALVGDPSDKIPGCPGFGPGAFTDMIVKYDEDVLDEIKTMLENRTLGQLKEYAADFKPFQKILDNEELVYQCYQCAKPIHPGWTGLDWQARFPSPNGDLGKWAKVEKLITKDVFNSPGFIDGLIKDLHEGPVSVRGFDLETWMDSESLQWCEDNKSSNGKKPIDVVGCHMAGFSLTLGENNEKCYYFPVDHKDTNNISLVDMTLVLNMLPDEGILAVHNAGYELPVTRKHCELRFDRGWLPNVWCTQILANYVDENHELGLKYCTKHYFNYEQATYADVVGEGQMSDISGEAVLSYGCDDSIATAQLWNLFDIITRYEGTQDAYRQCELATAYLFAEATLNGLKFDLKRLEELRVEAEKVYKEEYAKIQEFLLNFSWTTGDFDEGVIFEHKWPGCEFVPAEALTAQEVKRVFLSVTGEPLGSSLRKIVSLGNLVVDKGYVDMGVALASEDLEAFNKAAIALWNPDPQINLGSPKQLGDLMYTALKLPVRKYGKVSDKMRAEGRTKGNPSTDDDAVKMAMVYDCEDRPEVKELFQHILAAKGKLTENSLYFTPYPKAINPKTGMVHPSAGQSRTTSKRSSPNNINYAQVSKKSPIREVYVPLEEGMVWVSLDLSQQELRITAHQSQCKNMLACYPWDGPSKDLHSVTGVEIAKLVYKLDTTYEELFANKDHGVFKKARNDAKPTNFGDIYGQSCYGLAVKLIVTEEVAQSMLDAKEKAFPGVAQWKKDREEFMVKNGYAVTMLGARRHLELDGTWKDKGRLRSGINSEVQSPAAEQIKLILSELWRSKVFDRYNGYFLFPVHDEINYCIYSENLVESVREIHPVMIRQYANMSVPSASSIEIGPNFGQLASIGEEFDAEKVAEAGRVALEKKN